MIMTLMLCKTWRRRQQTIVFVNGCFDVLHLGHWHLLSQAKKFGHKLIVAVNCDRYCREAKGEARPIQPDVLRASVAGAIVDADAAVIFSEDSPEILLSQIQPDVYVLGSDYQGKTIPGAHHCGQVKFVDRLPGYSTTKSLLGHPSGVPT